jgi:putative methyltransferase (TIGR04325 family)
MIEYIVDKKRNQNIFYGKYDSFDFAISEMKNRNAEVGKEVFLSDRWRNRQRTFMDMAQDGVSPRFSTLPSFIANHEDIDLILDIGGGSGWVFYLLNAMTKRSLTYINFELREICEEFSKEFSNIEDVHFVDSWELIFDIKEISIIYSNSTMQYISDVNFFENFKKIKKPKYIVFDDLIVTNFKSYWTLQNYYGVFIPYCFRNLEEFNLKLVEQGYSIVSVEDYRQTLSPGYIYGDERMPITIIYQLDK